MKRIKYILISALVLFSVLQIQANKIDFSQAIKTKWKCVNVTSGNSGVTHELEQDDFLIFDNDSNTFQFDFVKENPNVSGTYTIIDSTIVLSFYTKMLEKEVDSMAFRVIDDLPELVFFYNGQVVTSIKQNEIQYQKFVREFNIDYCSKDTLIINDRGVSYLYVNTDQSEIAVPTEYVEEESSFLISLLRGMLGILVVLFIAYLFSSNRKAINWRSVIIGLSFQIVIAVLVLKVPFIQYTFEIVGKMFIKVLDFTKEGSTFLFKSFISDQVESPLVNFAFWILPTIIFFSALTSVLYYYGIIQKVVYGLAWLMKKAMKLSGAESLSAAGNIFLGQTESPLLIKAYLAKMTKSEILLVMVGGMATIAGGVLAIYIGFLGGDDPVQRMLFAKHLITASVMAAPGAVVAAKILVPQTEEIDTSIKVEKEKIGSNVLDAISNGTTEGIKLAVNVAAMLLVFIAFVALLNFIFFKIGDATTLNAWIQNFTEGQYDKLSIQFILGYSLAPLTWMLGVSSADITLVGQLLGEKLILNELIAYKSLKEYMDLSAFASQKSVIISTYILCGFANVGSIGIQLGGIGALAPNQRKNLSKLGLKALLGGTLASLLSATIVGIILS